MSDQTAATNLELAAETMLGDLTKIVIDEIKAAPDVWPKLSQHQQDDIIARCNSQIGDAVRECVRMIHADGRTVITADLEQITAKDGIKATLTLPKHDENRHALLDSVGKPVLIVVSDPSPFLAGDLPKSDPDQPDLIDTPVADNGKATALAA